MSTEENKVAARRILESYNDGQLAAKTARDELFAPGVVVHFPDMPEPIRGREAFEQIINMFAASFGDDHLTVEDQVAEGDAIATRWTWHFTHHGAFQGISPTGRRVTVIGINLERWVEMDQLGMMQQLGVIPSSGEATTHE